MVLDSFQGLQGGGETTCLLITTHPVMHIHLHTQYLNTELKGTHMPYTDLFTSVNSKAPYLFG